MGQRRVALPARAFGSHRPMGHATNLLDVTLSYGGRVALATAVELALVLGPPFAIAALAQLVVLQAERRAEGLVGRRAHWVAAGWLATALHEGGHAAFALLFGHRVRHVKWFDFSAEGGTLGRVDHDYDPSSVYQRAGRFFIGVGPVVLGAIVLAVAARLLVGAEGSSAHSLPAGHGAATPRATFDLLAAQLGAAARGVGRLVEAMEIGDWRSWLFLYVAYVCGNAMRLSASDLESLAAGGWTILWLLLLVNALTAWLGAVGTSAAVHVARAMALGDAALLAALSLQALVGVSAWGLALAVAALRARGEPVAG